MMQPTRFGDLMLTICLILLIAILLHMALAEWGIVS